MQATESTLTLKHRTNVTKRSAGVEPEVNLKEHVTCTPPPSANKAAHSGFDTQTRHHQKSETGLSVVPQKGLISLKKNFLHFFKNSFEF